MLKALRGISSLMDTLNPQHEQQLGHTGQLSFSTAGHVAARSPAAMTGSCRYR